jgi:LPXTG-motif cell wall-anchored protein
MVVLTLFCAAVVLGAAGVAAAAYPGPNEPSNPTIEVGGISVTRSAGTATSSTSSQLANTGSHGVGTLVWIAGGLVLAGGGIVFMSYRRRASLGA